MAHTFTIGGVFKEARGIIKPKLWTVIRQYFAISLIFGIIGTLAGTIGSIFVSILASFVITVFSLAYAENGSFSYHEFIKTLTFPKFAYYFLGVLVSGIFIGLGFVALIIPGIMLAVRFAFVKFIVAEKQVGPLEACRQSAKFTDGNRWKLLGFFVAAFFFNLLGMLCLVVGLLYTLPVTRIAIAVAYKKLRDTNDFVPNVVEVIETETGEPAPAVV